MAQKFYKIASLFCLLAAVFFLIPLFGGLHHIGMFYPAALLLMAAYLLYRPLQLRKWLTGRHRVLFRILAGLTAAGLLGILAIFSLMVRQAENRPASPSAPTVLVLGCEVIGHRPGRMLSDRIDAAYAFLAENPDAVCIACGGMADDEIITEALCIRDELVRRGISSERIYLEERSENTAQNIAFAADIIRQKNLPADIAVASDNFHQLRASIYARQNGLQARSLGCRSYWLLSPGYWAREVIAVAAARAFGR